MKKGAILTHEQCSQLAGRVYKDSSYFIYDQDTQGNFYITEEMVTECNEQNYLWVKDLPIVQYQPK
jgi:hypothetical protein